jgi:hypothetical protein
MTAIEKMNNFQLAGREVRPFFLILSFPSIADLHLPPDSQIKVGLVADRSATFNKHLQSTQEAQLEREESSASLFSPLPSLFRIEYVLTRVDEQLVNSTTTLVSNSCRNSLALIVRLSFRTLLCAFLPLLAFWSIVLTASPSQVPP